MKSYVRPLEGDIATKINKTIIYLVRYRKGEERLYFIGRIEDVRIIYESSTLDENTETIKPPSYS